MHGSLVSVPFLCCFPGGNCAFKLIPDYSQRGAICLGLSPVAYRSPGFVLLLLVENLGSFPQVDRLVIF